MKKLTVKEMAIFAFLGALMFISKQLMEFLPNIHLLGMFTVLYTVVYRKKALVPLYIFVLLEGIIAGFSMWWIPYLYIWTVLWAVTMLLPQKMSPKIAVPVYSIVCGLHGLAYGTLYAPFQALWMHLSFKGMLAWIASGLPWDVIHMLGNIVLGTMVYPLSRLLKKLNSQLGICTSGRVPSDVKGN